MWMSQEDAGSMREKAQCPVAVIFAQEKVSPTSQHPASFPEQSQGFLQLSLKCLIWCCWCTQAVLIAKFGSLHRFMMWASSPFHICQGSSITGRNCKNSSNLKSRGSVVLPVIMYSDKNFKRLLCLHRFNKYFDNLVWDRVSLCGPDWPELAVHKD